MEASSKAGHRQDHPNEEGCKNDGEGYFRKNILLLGFPKKFESTPDIGDNICSHKNNLEDHEFSQKHGMLELCGPMSS